MNLPTAAEMDAWLTGYAACLGKLLYYHPEKVAHDILHLEVIKWLRAHNDRAVSDCPELPELERRMGAARTLEAKHEALRALLAARDLVVSRKAHHDALQAQAVFPLQLGLHPTGVGGEE